MSKSYLLNFYPTNDEISFFNTDEFVLQKTKENLQLFLVNIQNVLDEKQIRLDDKDNYIEILKVILTRLQPDNYTILSARSRVYNLILYDSKKGKTKLEPKEEEFLNILIQAIDKKMAEVLKKSRTYHRPNPNADLSEQEKIELLTLFQPNNVPLSNSRNNYYEALSAQSQDGLDPGQKRYVDTLKIAAVNEAKNEEVERQIDENKLEEIFVIAAERSNKIELPVIMDEIVKLTEKYKNHLKKDAEKIAQKLGLSLDDLNLRKKDLSEETRSILAEYFAKNAWAKTTNDKYWAINEAHENLKKEKNPREKLEIFCQNIEKNASLYKEHRDSACKRFFAGVANNLLLIISSAIIIPVITAVTIPLLLPPFIPLIVAVVITLIKPGLIRDEFVEESNYGENKITAKNKISIVDQFLNLFNKHERAKGEHLVDQAKQLKSLRKTN